MKHAILQDTEAMGNINMSRCSSSPTIIVVHSGPIDGMLGVGLI
jgi:hypothetical protein